MNNSNEQKNFFEWKQDQQVQEAIGYKFKNPQLICQAFTTKSYSEEVKTVCNNEVLEFYGDKALEFVVMKKMSEYYGSVNEFGDYASKKSEGELTDIKKKLVCGEMLSGKIRELNFQGMSICSVYEVSRRLHKQEKLQENLFEAILGAVAIDSNWDVEALTKVVDKMLTPNVYFENGIDGEADYIKLLEQWSMKKYKVEPLYSWNVGGWRGFKGWVFIPPKEHEHQPFEGDGANRKEACRDAAKKAYFYLSKNNMLISREDEVGKLEFERAVNQLQELYQKGYIGEPVYTFDERHDKDGNVFWDCKCEVEDQGVVFKASDPSKKIAKKRAAYWVAKSFLEEDEKNET